MSPDVASLPAGEVFVMTRRFRADPQDIWDLWTTANGIEQWWGPPGFAVTVQEIDLRAGGMLRYTMTAVDPQMIAFMQSHGMPTATPAQVTYTEVAPLCRLAYDHLVDFVPGQKPYATALAVDFTTDAGVVDMVLTFQRLHDAEWTERQRMGWEQELGRLDALLLATGKGAVL